MLHIYFKLNPKERVQKLGRTKGEDAVDISGRKRNGRFSAHHRVLEQKVQQRFQQPFVVRRTGGGDGNARHGRRTFILVS